ncbi:MAG: redoxin family protein [Kiritimatiellae bacterium]|jgi:thiol-disulfide isomerase/thioredoxin|nr:redoxin family protein [Kiritimatiellia bacterium]HPC18846.1 thioredoxin family protein [Kiritimatiellia bacterium]HQN80630.1 thioredoxin family protein [Kiritimatiellia bacterium]HQQ60143.1 thioredoxin family protein [Kiritimatiellia bacterium]
MKPNIIVLLMLFLGLPLAGAQEIRTWTSASGKTLEAALADVKGDQVVLRSPAGELIQIRLNQLSSADQIFVGSHRTGRPPVAPGAGAAAPEAPASPVLEELFGRRLEGVKGRRMSTGELAGKKIGIYFTASWCPPCRAFTPELVKVYNQLQADHKPFEVVLVTSDKDERSMDKYMKDYDMPWVAVPFGDKRIDLLKKKFSVSGIPKLVVIDDAGQILSANARGEVTAQGVQAFDRW